MTMLLELGKVFSDMSRRSCVEAAQALPFPVVGVGSQRWPRGVAFASHLVQVLLCLNGEMMVQD